MLTVFVVKAFVLLCFFRWNLAPIGAKNNATVRFSRHDLLEMGSTGVRMAARQATWPGKRLTQARKAMSPSRRIG